MLGGVNGHQHLTLMDSLHISGADIFLHISDAVMSMHSINAMILFHVVGAVLFMHVLDGVIFMHTLDTVIFFQAYVLGSTRANGLSPTMGPREGPTRAQSTGPGDRGYPWGGHRHQPPRDV